MRPVLKRNNAVEHGRFVKEQLRMNVKLFLSS